MIKRIRELFGIKEDTIKVEWMDISTILTVTNVILIVCGVAWAPVVGIVNAVANIIILILKRGHINAYVMNAALIILNIYFLKG